MASLLESEAVNARKKLVVPAGLEYSPFRHRRNVAYVALLLLLVENPFSPSCVFSQALFVISLQVPYFQEWIRKGYEPFWQQARL